MGKSLWDHQINQYQDAGYLCPVAALSAVEVDGYRRKLEALMERHGGKLPSLYKHKLHLMVSWVDELVHHPQIVDSIEDLLGPDILCWTSNFLIKPPQHAAFVSWHQDSQYWGLEPPEVVTAWVALSASTEESGCVRVIRGSHLEAEQKHTDTFDKDNMLTRGQSLDVDESGAVDLVLAAGEMSLHDIRLVHGSGPNASNDFRMGLAIRYMSARVRKAGQPESATWLRGDANGGNFLLEPRPSGDETTGGRMAHNRAVRRQVANNYETGEDTPLRERVRLTLHKRLFQGGLDLLYAWLCLRRVFSSK